MFYELAELQDFTEGELRHTARSAAGLWRTMESSISAAMDLEKATIFVPDGAQVFGAQQAETCGGEPQEGSNVSHLWNEWRLSKGLPSLEVLHCVAHRAALANKHSKDTFSDSWQTLISRQYWTLKESGGLSEEFARVCADLALPKQQLLMGTERKCIGFAEAQLQDCQLWSAKSIFGLVA